MSVRLRYSLVALAVLASVVVSSTAGADGFGDPTTPGTGISSGLGANDPTGLGTGLDTGTGLGTGTDGTGLAGIFPDPATAAPDLGLLSVESTALTSSDSLALAQSPYPLSQVDLSTGAVIGPDITTTLSSDATTTLAVAGAGALIIDQGILAAQSMAQQAVQQAQSASGCPVSAPPGTLRSGATNIAQLCADSVAQARSPQAASAIKYALNNLGVPYSQAQRNEVGYYDCSSFVSRAYEAAGVNIAPAGVNAPTTYTIANAPWAIQEPFSDAKPGDLVEPDSGHVVMLLADGYLAQASMPGDVTNVTTVWWSTPYLAVWIDPSKV